MSQAGSKKEGEPQIAGTTFKTTFNICFYGASLAWVAYATYILAKGNNGKNFEVYALFHSTLVGFITYKAITDLKLKGSYLFKKYNLVPLFISFSVTAPLASLPLIIGEILRYHDSKCFIENVLPFMLAFLGQLYWLLLPVQVAITYWGKEKLFLSIGYCILFLGAFNFFIILFFMGRL